MTDANVKFRVVLDEYYSTPRPGEPHTQDWDLPHCVHWEIGNATGHGQGMRRHHALNIAKEMIEVYGKHTHWVLPVEGATREKRL